MYSLIYTQCKSMGKVFLGPTALHGVVILTLWQIGFKVWLQRTVGSTHIPHLLDQEYNRGMNEV